jgi:hypothetical protein
VERRGRARQSRLFGVSGFDDGADFAFVHLPVRRALAQTDAEVVARHRLAGSRVFLENKVPFPLRFFNTPPPVLRMFLIGGGWGLVRESGAGVGGGGEGILERMSGVDPGGTVDDDEKVMMTRCRFCIWGEGREAF